MSDPTKLALALAAIPLVLLIPHIIRAISWAAGMLLHGFAAVIFIWAEWLQ